VLSANEQNGIVATGPWAGRDGFIADTAVKLDRLQAKLERLEHQGEVVKQHLAELMDNAHRTNRLQALEESLRNSREYKIDELLRCVKDAKARLDQLEGPRAVFNGLTYRSFDAVDAKLTELGLFQRRYATLERHLKITAALFCGSVLLLATTLVARLA
jgi:chromosome segregation ATPase